MKIFEKSVEYVLGLADKDVPSSVHIAMDLMVSYIKKTGEQTLLKRAHNEAGGQTETEKTSSETGPADGPAKGGENNSGKSEGPTNSSNSGNNEANGAGKPEEPTNSSNSGNNGANGAGKPEEPTNSSNSGNNGANGAGKPTSTLTDEERKQLAERFAKWCEENGIGTFPPKEKETSDSSGKPLPKVDEICVHHKTLKPGDTCPECGKGKLYEVDSMEDDIKVFIKELIKIKRYLRQRLRCNACGWYATAERPPEAGESNGHSGELVAYVVIMRCNGGMPYNRSGSLNKSLGLSLTKQQVYAICADFAEMFSVVIAAMRKEVANCPVIANDSTTAKIIEVSKIKESPTYKPGSKKNPSERSSSRTSVVIGFDSELQPVGCIFHTGQMHSGEFMETILDDRDKELAAPVVMADMATTSDTPQFNAAKDEEKPYIRAGCNDHALRKIEQALKAYPQNIVLVHNYQCIYAHDALIKDRNLPPADRLKVHRNLNASRMEQIKSDALAIKNGTGGFIKAEPNSIEGKAVAYFLKYWDCLTGFLNVVGVPLSNCSCEQALKKMIWLRNSSRVFRTLKGAATTDSLQTLIHTAGVIEVNAFEYCLALCQNQDQVKQNPHLWTPRAYKTALKQQNLPSSTQSSDAPCSQPGRGPPS
jgi:transposase